MNEWECPICKSKEPKIFDRITGWAGFFNEEFLTGWQEGSTG